MTPRRLPSPSPSRHPGRVKRMRIAVALAGLLALASTALADEMQCEGRLIGNGATIDEVLRLCGEPLRRVKSERVVDTGLFDSPISGQQRIPVEEWTYSPPGEFSRKLVFEGGKLVKVETGGYADLD